MGMSEYIEREAVNALIKAECSPKVAAYLIDAVATIHAADVRHVEWIPVKERLPQICTNVLVAGRMKYRWEHKYLQFVDKACFNEGEFFETDNDWYEGQDEFEITHWMPLPQPPKEE